MSTVYGAGQSDADKGEQEDVPGQPDAEWGERDENIEDESLLLVESEDTKGALVEAEVLVEGHDDLAFAYRPDIDGLRAVAVSAVVLFHLDRKFLPGGFTGVDIFFVISGYVVSGALLKARSPSRRDFFVGFYIRRIKRIVPPLVVSSLATAVALAILIPPQTPALDGFYDSGMLALVGLANVRYAMLSESGSYFDDGDGPDSLQANPFLHNWSLGVEEQFYFIFPLLLFATHGALVAKRAARRPAWCNQLVLWVVIVEVSALFSWVMTMRDSQGAFFMLPARFWEMALGSVTLQMRVSCLPASFFVERRCERIALEFSAVTLMVCGLLITSEESCFPFPAAGVSVAGAVLFIAAGSCSESVVNRCLSHWFFVYIGKLSYSLYLWHWPVFVMLRWALGPDALASLKMMLGAVGVAFALAATTYHLVENPMRSWRPRQGQWFVALVLLLAVSGVELCIFALRGPYAGRLYFDAVGEKEPWEPWVPSATAPAQTLVPEEPSDAWSAGGIWNFSDATAATANTSPAPPPGTSVIPSGPQPGGEYRLAPVCECRMHDRTNHTPPGARSGDAAANLRPCFTEVPGWNGGYPAWAGKSEGKCYPRGHTIPKDWKKIIHDCLKPDSVRPPGQRVFFLVGDSHMAHLLPLIRPLADAVSAEVRVVASICGGFLAKSGIESWANTKKHWQSYCEDFSQELRTVLESGVQAGDVVFVSNIAKKLPAGAAVDDFRALLVEHHRILVERQATLVVIEDTPFLPHAGRSCVPNSLQPDSAKMCEQPRAESDLYINPSRSMLDGLTHEHPDILFFDLQALLCTTATCGALLPGTHTLGIFDRHHLTEFTGQYLFPFLCAFLDEHGILV